jgi:site-specific DNA-methyltransferase (adenine-specific)
MSVDLRLGDCLEAMRVMPDASVDSIVTDPPYGLSFMGKKWDYDVPSSEIWAECLRVLKPGGHLLAFAGTRTQHRMAVRIEDAGFEIRDMIAWVYGSGFPKSLDVSKAIDKAAGAEREVIGDKMRPDGKTVLSARSAIDPAGEGWDRPWRHDPARTEAQGKLTAPATDAARQWQGWGTALKPALEPITVARKPLVGTVAANVLVHGTGALNIDGCRVGDFQNTTPSGVDRRNAKLSEMGYRPGEYQMGEKVPDTPPGRWPANLIHDGSEPADLLGEAARFFYCAKASKSDRDEGLEGFEAKPANSAYGDGLNTATKVRTEEQAESGVSRDLRRNSHPTVKPTELMRYLCRLVTPPGGVVLDPFMGSGSTGKAAVGEGFRFVGCEMSPEYMAIAKVRIQRALEQFLGDLA